MPTINQLIRKGRVKNISKSKVLAERSPKQLVMYSQKWMTKVNKSFYRRIMGRTETVIALQVSSSSK